MAGQAQISTRTIVRVFFTLVVLVVLLYVLYLVRSVVGLLCIAIFLSVALGPAVDRIKRLKLPRAASILAVFLGMFLAIFLIGLIVVPPIVNEVEAFAGDVPELHRRHPLEQDAARVRRQVRHHQEARGAGEEPAEQARSRRRARCRR